MAEAHEKLDAAFFAFKKRDKRFVLTRAAVGYFILYLVTSAAFVALSWNSLSSLMAWYGTVIGEAMRGGDPAQPPVEAMGIVPYAFAAGVLSLAIFAAFEAACLRWLVRGESGGALLGLTLGADTWRVFATYFMWLLLFIAFTVLIVLFYVLTSLIANMGGAARLIAMVLGALAPLGFIALLIWGAVRFAPAAATSIARRRFAFFEAPRVTKGIFWPLLGAFVVLWIGYLVITLVVGQIIQLPAQNVMMPVVTEMMTGGGDIGSRMVEAMSSPIYLASMGAYLVFSAIAAIVFYIAMFGVNARAVLAADETQRGATPA
jgi:hypothetical protein